jgi:hypothetical protein
VIEDNSFEFSVKISSAFPAPPPLSSYDAVGFSRSMWFVSGRREPLDKSWEVISLRQLLFKTNNFSSPRYAGRWVVSPFRRCNACIKVGSIFTSQEQTMHAKESR